MSSPRPRIAIVTPALADANNGNWQTAQRWARLLRTRYAVRLAAAWEPSDAARDEALLIALHARKSAPAVAAWRAVHGSARPVLLVLTGTDLYGEIATGQVTSAEAAALAQATRLVVLNELGLRALPPRLAAKASVCLQSARPRATLPKPTWHVRAVVVGHLRAVKAPELVWEAARRLAPGEGIRIDHLGAELEPGLADAARACVAAAPHYRWLGAVSHAVARARIQRASLLLHPSTLEGGAHVVVEAITSGTPVIASHIDGNLGLLGADYAGTFAPGDAAALAARLRQARDEPAFLAHLAAQCAARAARFAPAAEHATLHALVQACLQPEHAP